MHQVEICVHAGLISTIWKVETAWYIFSGVQCNQLWLETLLSQNFYCTTFKCGMPAMHDMTPFSGLVRTYCERIIDPHSTALVAMVRRSQYSTSHTTYKGCHGNWSSQKVQEWESWVHGLANYGCYVIVVPWLSRVYVICTLSAVLCIPRRRSLREYTKLLKGYKSHGCI